MRISDWSSDVCSSDLRSMSMSALRASIRSRTGIVLSETFINALLAFVTYAVIVRITDLATVGLWALVSSLMAFARSVDVWSRGVSAFVAQRSEEHTSELQSLMRISYAVFCLKKKTNTVHETKSSHMTQHQNTH